MLHNHFWVGQFRFCVRSNWVQSSVLLSQHIFELACQLGLLMIMVVGYIFNFSCWFGSDSGFSSVLVAVNLERKLFGISAVFILSFTSGYYSSCRFSRSGVMSI